MLERQPLVLVANDDDAMRDALKFALQLENFEVHVHAGGAELLADADLCRARCLILKERMPNMGGLEVMHLLRAVDISLPAILLTANASPVLRARAAHAGFRLVLEKPILGNALLEGIMAMLEPAKPADSLST